MNMLKGHYIIFLKKIKKSVVNYTPNFAPKQIYNWKKLIKMHMPIRTWCATKKKYRIKRVDSYQVIIFQENSLIMKRTFSPSNKRHFDFLFLSLIFSIMILNWINIQKSIIIFIKNTICCFDKTIMIDKYLFHLLIYTNLITSI